MQNADAEQMPSGLFLRVDCVIFHPVTHSATISIFDTSICDNLPLYVTLYTCSTRLPLLPLAPLLLYAPLPVYLLCFLAFLLSSKFQESQFLDTCMTQLLLARFPSFVAVLDV